MELQLKVAEAFHVLNHDTHSCNRVAANQWLVQFQQTDAAWEVATSILTSHQFRLHYTANSNFHPLFSSAFELELFTAQILKRKIQSEWYYLHLGAKDALLNALLLAAKRFSSGPSQVEVRVREGRAVNIHIFCDRRLGLLLSTVRVLDNLDSGFHGMI